MANNCKAVFVNNTPLVCTVTDNGDGTYTFNNHIDPPVTWSTGGADTDTSIVFNQVLPNGDWEFNVVDVLTNTVLTTFTVPAPTISIIDNGDNTFTYIDVAGNPTVIAYEHTLVDNNDGTFTFTQPDGTPTTIDVCKLQQDSGCAATMVDNGDGTYTWTDTATTFVIDTTDRVLSTVVYSPATQDFTFTWSNGDTTVVDLTALLNIYSLADGNNTTVTGDGVATPWEVNGYGIADNSDGTFTVTLPDGTTTFTIDTNETVTNIVGNTYTNEAGTPQAIVQTVVNTLDINGDLITTVNGVPSTPLVLPADIVTTLAAALDTTNPLAPTLVITYVNEDGSNAVQNVNLAALLDDTNTTYTVTNNNNGTITLVGSDGSTTTIDICAVVASGCPTTLTANVDGSFTFVGSDGTPVIIPAPAVVIPSAVTNTIVGNRIATHTPGGGTAVDINETITTIVNNGDGTATFTNEAGVAITFPIGGVDVVDNADGTYTVTLADGSVVTIGDTSTSTLVDNLDGTYTYTDEAGVVTTFDTTGVITTITNTVVGNKIADYTNEAGTVVPINETITSFAAITNGYQFVSEDGTVYPFTFTFDNSTPSAPQLLVNYGATIVATIPLNSYDVNIATTGGFALNPLTDVITITETDGEIHTIDLSYLRSTLTSTDGSVEIVTSINPDGSTNYDLGAKAPSFETQAIPYTGVELPLTNGVNIGDTNSTQFSDGTVVNYTWDGSSWVFNFQTSYFVTTAQDIPLFNFEKYPTGYVFQTSGFYLKEDGGAATYIIEEGLTSNGINIFTLSDGRYARYILNKDNSVNVLQLGAKGDDIFDNSVIFEKGIDILINGGELIFPEGTYRTSEPIIVKYNNTTLNSYGAIIKPLSSWDQKLYTGEFVKGIISIFGANTQHIYNVNIQGFKLDGTYFAGDPFLGQVGQNGIESWYADRVRISNNEVIGIENYGIWFSHGKDAIIDGNTVIGAAESIEVAQIVDGVVVSNNYVFGTSITVNQYLVYADAKNIKFIGNTSKGNGHAYSISYSNGGCSNISIENSYIDVSSDPINPSHGIIIDGSSIYDTTDIRIMNNFIRTTDNAGTPIKITGNEIVNDISIQGNTIYSPNYLGFYMDGKVGSNNLKISNNIIKSRIGNLINNITGLIFENNTVENSDVGGLQYDNVSGNIYQGNKFINSPISNPIQKTILLGNEFLGVGNNAINIGSNSYVFNNLGLQTNINTGTSSVLVNNHFQAYFGSGNSTKVNASEYRFNFPNVYFETGNKVSINTTENTYDLNVKGVTELESGGFGYGSPLLRMQYNGSDDYAHHGIFNNFEYFINNPYSGANDGGVIIASQGIRRFYIDKSGNTYFDSPITVTGATSADANTNAIAASIPVGVTYKWDDGNAIHLMIRK